MNILNFSIAVFLFLFFVLESESQIKSSVLKRITKEYEYVEEFSEGYAVVEKNLVFRYIDSTGRHFINGQFYDANAFSEGLACVANYVGSGKSRAPKYGFINKKGDIVIDYKYEFAESFSNGFAVVNKTNPDTSIYGSYNLVYGVINKKGELLGNQWFSNLKIHNQDSITVRLRKKVGYLMPDGTYNLENEDIPQMNKKKDSSLVNFYVIEEKPVFNYDGINNTDKAVVQYIGYNVKYPESCKEKGIQGKVFVQFVISRTGKVIDVVLLKGAHPVLNKEALRIIKAMPDWQPGKQRGKPVKVSFQIPINFKLN